MSHDSAKNPYQPPKADLFNEGHAPPNKMPASSKWALACSVLLLIGWSLTSGLLLIREGISALFDGWFESAIAIGDVVCRAGLIIGLTFGTKKPWGHRLSSLAMLVIGALSLMAYLRFRLFLNGEVQLFDAGIAALIYFGLFKLFHSFTFGIDSRRYYGVR